MILVIIFLLAFGAKALQNPPGRSQMNPPQSLRATTPTHHAQHHQYLKSKTERFFVNGSNIPEVDFDVGESYAGLLPNTRAGNSSLFFWYFPSHHVDAKDEITVWLNGGPGCSSLAGMLQGNGPFVWRPGTYKPIVNPYSWTNLTNMVYVDQPAGTGFSPGPSTVQDERDVAGQFKTWFKNFVDTFDLQGRKVYITGESYAGKYVPYIASAMLDENDTAYFDVRGIQIIDPVINSETVMTHAPAVAHLNHYQNIFSLNKSFVDEVNERAVRCGYHTFLDKALNYPPPNPFPLIPGDPEEICALWDEVTQAAYYVNPCFNFYHLTDYCPYLWNQMGFPSLAGGPNNYFNRSDVQALLHVPQTSYSVCRMHEIFPNRDQSPPSAFDALPKVIERTNNTIITHGWLDFLLFMNGSLATIQNMTWNGLQGFQSPPTEPLYVPYHYGLAEVSDSTTAPRPFTLDAGAGYLGTSHTERGLTFTTIYLAGHEVPQYAPGAAYRHLEFLLGRVNSLSEPGEYTT